MGRHKIVHNECMGYAVLVSILNPSGAVAFWQQATRWYQYRKCAENAYNRRYKTYGNKA